MTRAPRHGRGADRISGAPISWGVCEVPGWGELLPPGRVLDDLADLGLVATELGPDGWLAEDAAGVRAALDARGLQLAGGFVTAVLHDAGRRDAELESLRRQAARLGEAGSHVLVLACATGLDGYDERVELDDAGWDVLLRGIEDARDIAHEAGIRCALHPHVGTIVEFDHELQRVLDGSTVGLCIDTGHMAIGGIDTVRIVREHASRIQHVHLKDIVDRLGARVRDGTLPYAEAVRCGLYTPLGRGDARVSDIVMDLEAAGYSGWYVLEQDVRWAVGDADPVRDVVTSRDLVRSLLEVAAA